MWGTRGLPCSSIDRFHLQCRGPWFNSWIRKIPWRRDSVPNPEFLGLLVAQLVKNLPAVWETGVQSLCRKFLWRRELITTPVFWPGEFNGQRSLAGYSPWGCKEVELIVNGQWLNRVCLCDDTSKKTPKDRVQKASGLSSALRFGETGQLGVSCVLSHSLSYASAPSDCSWVLPFIINLRNSN